MWVQYMELVYMASANTFYKKRMAGKRYFYKGKEIKTPVEYNKMIMEILQDVRGRKGTLQKRKIINNV